jgi:hypothetical protein
MFENSQEKGGWALAAILLLAPVAAHAGTVSYSDTIPSSSSNYSQNLNFSQFDPSQGVLLSVTLADSFTLIDSFSAACGNVTVNATFTGISGVTENLPLGGFGCPGGGSNSPSYTPSSVLTGGAMAPFLGTGSVSLPIAFSFTVTHDPGASGGAQVTNGTATVTYTFDAPEPATFSLGLLGAIIAAAWAARTRRRPSGIAPYRP